MDDPEEQAERADLISRMFALVTAKLEDAAAIAVECQGRKPISELLANGRRVQDLVRETVTITDGAIALIEGSDLKT